MIRIPLYLAIAQWALLGALGVLVVLLFRQLGRLLTGTAPKEQLGPVVGARAAALTYARPGQDATRRLTPGGGQPLLLAFVDPTCRSCEELVDVLGQLSTDGELAGLRTLLLISDPPDYLQISDAFGSTRLEIGRPARREGLDSYRVSATPLLVAVDGDGVVRAAGSVVHEPDIRAFRDACIRPGDPTAAGSTAAGPTAAGPTAAGSAAAHPAPAAPVLTIEPAAREGP